MSKFIFDTSSLLQKSETKDYIEFEGLASTDHKDFEDETIKQNFDLSAIDAGKGYVNADHGHNYENKDHARMGVIDEAKITPKGLHLKGKIWKDHPESISYINELKYKPGMVQLSVEGYTLERDPNDKKIVKRAYVAGVALTRNPVNPHTFAKLVKSLKGEVVEAPKKVPLIKSHNIHIEKDKDNKVQTVTVTKVFNPEHEDFSAMYELERQMILKGGPGSGKKGTGQKIIPPAQHKQVAAAPEAVKEVVVDKPEDDDKQKRRRSKDDFERQVETAKEMGHSAAESKQNVRALKQQRQLASKKRKLINVKLKKSLLKAELMRRAGSNPEFKKSLEQVLAKALTTGGPAYATTTPGNMVNGNVMQSEEKVGSKKEKCMKCMEKGKMCKACKKSFALGW